MSPPERALHVLDSIYPGSKQIHWSKKGKKFTANFIYNGLSNSVTLDRSGQLLYLIEEISYEALPNIIKEKVQRFYPTYKILLVSRSTKHERPEYDIEIIQGNQHFILNYHAKGYLIHQYEVYKYDASIEFSD